ncbi:hypothetical protein BDW66DRAFT_158831 [Aspergillus desertorum]
MLSSRGRKNAASFGIPWHSAVPQPTKIKRTPTASFTLKYLSGPLGTDIAINTTPPCQRQNPLPAAISSHLINYFKPLIPIAFEVVVKVSGCSATGNMLSSALTEPGNAVLVSRPVYGRFELDYGVQGGMEDVYVDADVYETFDVRRRRGAVKIGAVILIICIILLTLTASGRCYKLDTLVETMKLRSRHRIHLISDEIYARCILDSDSEAVPFTSVSSLGRPEIFDPNLVRVLYKLSESRPSPLGGLHLIIITLDSVEPARHAGCTRLVFKTCSEMIGPAISQDADFVTRFTKSSQRNLAHSYQIANSILNQEGIVKDNLLQTQEHGFALAQRSLDEGCSLHLGEDYSKEPGWLGSSFRLEHVFQEVLTEVCLLSPSPMAPS